MISHRCRYKARGSVLIRIFTSSSVRWAAARVTLAISSLFCFRSSPPLFYHSTRIRIRAKLLRFLIRMSTRPTPFGLFAGVALGHWGAITDLALSAEPPRTATRPDMAWLLPFVQKLESRLDIRKHL